MNLLSVLFDCKRCTTHHTHYDHEEEKLYLTSHDSDNNSTTEDTVSSIFIHFLTSDYVLSI